MSDLVTEESAEGLDQRPLQEMLVLGLGNTVLTDDGVGVHVIRALESNHILDDSVTTQDGGTVGLGLLPEISRSDVLIVVDAAELDAVPGTIRVFEADAMDIQVGKNKGSVHEIALSDLMTAAAILGTRPKRRALVAIQPAEIGWGTEPTTEIAEVIPEACATVARLVRKWMS